MVATATSNSYADFFKRLDIRLLVFPTKLREHKTPGGGLDIAYLMLQEERSNLGTAFAEKLKVLGLLMGEYVRPENVVEHEPTGKIRYLTVCA